MILLIYLTAIGLTPGGSSTVYIYTQTVHRTAQLTTFTAQLTTLATPFNNFDKKINNIECWKVFWDSNPEW